MSTQFIEGVIKTRLEDHVKWCPVTKSILCSSQIVCLLLHDTWNLFLMKGVLHVCSRFSTCVCLLLTLYSSSQSWLSKKLRIVELSKRQTVLMSVVRFLSLYSCLCFPVSLPSLVCVLPCPSLFVSVYVLAITNMHVFVRTHTSHSFFWLINSHDSSNNTVKAEIN